MIISGWRTSHASLYTDTDEYSGGYNRSRPCRRAWKPTNPKKTIQKAKPNVNDFPNLLTACFDAVNHPVTAPSAKPSDTLEAHPITPCTPTSLDPRPSFPAIPHPLPHPNTSSNQKPHPIPKNPGSFRFRLAFDFSFALSLSKGRPFVVSLSNHERTTPVTPNNEPDPAQKPTKLDLYVSALHASASLTSSLRQQSSGPRRRILYIPPSCKS